MLYSPKYDDPLLKNATNNVLADLLGKIDESIEEGKEMENLPLAGFHLLELKRCELQMVLAPRAFTLSDNMMHKTYTSAFTYGKALRHAQHIGFRWSSEYGTSEMVDVDYLDSRLVETAQKHGLEVAASMSNGMVSKGEEIRNEDGEVTELDLDLDKKYTFLARVLGKLDNEEKTHGQGAVMLRALSAAAVLACQETPKICSDFANIHPEVMVAQIKVSLEDGGLQSP